jgi:hypothetical protein
MGTRPSGGIQYQIRRQCEVSDLVVVGSCSRSGSDEPSLPQERQMFNRVDLQKAGNLQSER